MTTICDLLELKGRAVHCVDADQTVFEAIAKMDAENIGGLLVMEQGKVVGILTERDYLRKVILKNRSSKETPVRMIMTSELVTVTPETSVETALSIMTERRCRHLPIYEDDALVGIVSIGDLVKSIIAGQQAKIQLLEDYVWMR